MENIDSLISAIKELKEVLERNNQVLENIYQALIRIEYKITDIKEDVDILRNKVK